jgi:hypothetical protein
MRWFDPSTLLGVVIADVEAVVVAGRLLCSPVCTTVDP